MMLLMMAIQIFHKQASQILTSAIDVKTQTKHTKTKHEKVLIHTTNIIQIISLQPQSNLG